MSKRDVYEVLGVDKATSKQDIRKAYRKLAKKYHPDINKEKGSEEKFKEVKEAYEILNDDQKRAEYDQFGHASTRQGSGGGQGFGFGGQGPGRGQGFGGQSSGGNQGFEDIFETFFGGGVRQDPNAPRQGNDLQYTMTLTFEEAIFGKETRIKTSKKDDGTGRVQKQVTLKVSIPAGINEGQKIKLSGKGEAGINGGPPGDLYIVVHIRSHELYVREGNNIFSELPISFAQATLGGKVEAPTLHGNVKLKIPAGTQTGKTFRLKGKGVPNVNGNSQGDQHIQVRVITPKNLTSRAKELLKEFDEITSN